MILFKKNEDWKSLLREDAKILLSEVFDATRMHRAAYTSTPEVKFAQLWCALIEVRREIKRLNETIGKLENSLQSVLNNGEEIKKLNKRIEEVESSIKPLSSISKEETMPEEKEEQ
ncbi:MAG: hypothetical protein QMD14_02655 [Candidatus Aenigmarchaeota archaeon]|nr:hypothetical protein [Candidatus Aenigmarchaeota archaeon]